MDTKRRSMGCNGLTAPLSRSRLSDRNASREQAAFTSHKSHCYLHLDPECTLSLSASYLSYLSYLFWLSPLL